MQKMKNFRTVEHYLVPFGLALLNICVVHLIWIGSARGLSDLKTVSAVSLALLLLSSGIIFKRKFLLLLSCLFYLAALLISLIRH